MPRPSAKRRRLWTEFDGRCHWCGCRTVLRSPTLGRGRPPQNLATVDHLWSRFSPLRRQHEHGPLVLACHECNAVRNEIDLFLNLREHMWRTLCGQLNTPAGFKAAVAWIRREAAL